MQSVKGNVIGLTFVEFILSACYAGVGSDSRVPQKSV